MGLVNAIILHAKLQFAIKLESYENYYSYLLKVTEMKITKS